MPFERYPHAATITYVESGTFSSIGVYTPATTSVAIECRVEVNSSRYVITPGGDRIAYQFDVYCPVRTVVPEGAKLSFNGGHYKIYLGPNVYQKHVVLRCGK